MFRRTPCRNVLIVSWRTCSPMIFPSQPIISLFCGAKLTFNNCVGHVQPDDFSLSTNHIVLQDETITFNNCVRHEQHGYFSLATNHVIVLCSDTEFLLSACGTCSTIIFSLLTNHIIVSWRDTVIFANRLRHMQHGYYSLPTNHIIVLGRDTEFLPIACSTCSTFIFSLNQSQLSLFCGVMLRLQSSYCFVCP